MLSIASHTGTAWPDAGVLGRSFGQKLAETLIGDLGAAVLRRERAHLQSASP